MTSTPVLKGLPQTAPDDEYNRELVRQTHPTDWTNPTASGTYNLVVIGGGTAGLVTAAGAAGLGAKVALIEKHLLGGDCLNVGCVPSKGIIAAGRAARSIREASKFGVKVEGEVKVDFGEAMRQMRQTRAEISHHDSAARFRDLGVDVFLGDAKFVEGDAVEIEGQRLNYHKAVIATGSRALLPSIEGLNDVDYLTNETVFSLTELPRRMAVVGGGPIGCELAQTFAQLGSTVTLVQSGQNILSNDDDEAAEVVAASMRRDGVQVFCNAQVTKVAKDEAIEVTVAGEQGSQMLSVDALLLSVGRRPNIEDLGLPAAGVETTRQGVTVDHRLRTTNPKIFAAGDVCSKYKFTHAADFLARLVIQNALFMGRKDPSDLVIPYCTYTTPELAAVGLNESSAAADGVEVDVYRVDFDGLDRAMLERERDGFVKILCRKGTDQIVGGTIVGPHAGDMISEVTVAMTHSLGLSKLATSIHPYPTLAEAIRKAGDQYSRTRLTPRVKWAFDKWLAWRR